MCSGCNSLFTAMDNIPHCNPRCKTTFCTHNECHIIKTIAQQKVFKNQYSHYERMFPCWELTQLLGPLEVTGAVDQLFTIPCRLAVAVFFSVRGLIVPRRIFTCNGFLPKFYVNA